MRQTDALFVPRVVTYLRCVIIASVITYGNSPDSSPVARVGSWECQRLTRERAYSPVLKYNEGLWKSQGIPPIRIMYAKRNIDTFQKINILFTAKCERRVVNLY